MVDGFPFKRVPVFEFTGTRSFWILTEMANKKFFLTNDGEMWILPIETGITFGIPVQVTSSGKAFPAGI